MNTLCMYEWRKIEPEARKALLEERQRFNCSWHRPSRQQAGEWLHITAACYEHKSLIGFTPERMNSFSRDLLDCVSADSLEMSAWCLLPNHYHLLVRVMDEKILSKSLGKLHGRTSHTWNVEENLAGRKCFHGLLPKPIKSLEHRWATLNYIHHNPVKHGYVDKWQDWPYTSAHAYLKTMGKAQAAKFWRDYPVLDMGKGWDEETG
ncbi:transposase [Kiritimatiellaeota bacterium B1221]|nr:transposase [Kiritimatiellaeota bacterium B1221]